VFPPLIAALLLWTFPHSFNFLTVIAQFTLDLDTFFHEELWVPNPESCGASAIESPRFI
jgi:hypothetical protein